MELDGREDAVKRTPRLLNGHESEDLLKTPNPRPVSFQKSVRTASFASRKAISSEEGQNKFYPERNISNR